MILAIITAILGAYAGAEGTSLTWRRIGIPLICAIYTFIHTRQIWAVLPYLLWIAIFSLGYGKPDKDDKGSFLGRLLKKDSLIRGFIALLLSLCLSAEVFLHQVTLMLWLGCSAVLVGIWAIFGGDEIVKGEGKIRLLGKDLLVEDLILYGAVGGYISCLINGAPVLL